MTASSTGMDSQDFIAHYENDKMEETMDFDEWIGEFRLLERLREKLTLCDLCGFAVNK